MPPSLHITPTGLVDYGEPPEGSAPIPAGPRPYAGRVITSAALAVVIRLNAEWYPTRRSEEPQGRRANLSEADLREADLRWADLREANLSEADLRGADLREADLSEANLSEADLREADLRGANLGGANLGGAVGIVSEEEEAATWAAVRARVLADPTVLRMDSWHGSGWDPLTPGACGTTHCLAGWAQALSDDPEIRALPAEIAGSRLLPRHAHLFFRPNAEVLEILRAEEVRS